MTEAPNEELKMWLAVRTDLQMPNGKLAVQAGHAFSVCLLKAFVEDRSLVADYQDHAMPKIAVSVPGLAALQRVEQEALNAGIYTFLVVDAGRTTFTGPTATVCAFGPALRSELPSYLRRLRLLDPSPSTPSKTEGAER